MKPGRPQNVAENRKNEQKYTKPSNAQNVPNRPQKNILGPNCTKQSPRTPKTYPPPRNVPKKPKCNRECHSVSTRNSQKWTRALRYPPTANPHCKRVEEMGPLDLNYKPNRTITRALAWARTTKRTLTLAVPLALILTLTPILTQTLRLIPTRDRLNCHCHCIIPTSGHPLRRRHQQNNGTNRTGSERPYHKRRPSPRRAPDVPSPAHAPSGSGFGTECRGRA